MKNINLFKKISKVELYHGVMMSILDNGKKSFLEEKMMSKIKRIVMKMMQNL